METLTQESLEVLRTAVLRPVRVLEMPDRPLLPREEVLHLQARGGVAARVCAEPGCDLKPSVGDSVVPGAQSWPVPEALLPAALLSDKHTHGQATGHHPATGALTRTVRLKLGAAAPPRLLLLSRGPTWSTLHLRQRKSIQRQEDSPLLLSPLL